MHRVDQCFYRRYTHQHAGIAPDILVMRGNEHCYENDFIGKLSQRVDGICMFDAGDVFIGIWIGDICFSSHR